MFPKFSDFVRFSVREGRSEVFADVARVSVGRFPDLSAWFLQFPPGFMRSGVVRLPELHLKTYMLRKIIIKNNKKVFCSVKKNRSKITRDTFSRGIFCKACAIIQK